MSGGNKMIEHTKNWRNFHLSQQPLWENYDDVIKISKEISKLPALVFAGETRELRKKLIEVEKGNIVYLQCGDCSESFEDCNGPRIHNMIRIILQMSTILSHLTKKRILKIGRMAGQYAKPRSNDYEIIDNIKLPVYRGDMINSVEPTIEARRPDPKRMLEAYFRSVATLNLVRAFIKGGYASLSHVLDWQKHHFQEYPIMNKYKKLAKQIIDSLHFISVFTDGNFKLHTEDDLYISHEALILEYEEALTRIDTTTGLLYDTSAHMLWVGNRTRYPESAHIEFLKYVNNPIGIKIGPNYNVSEIYEIIKKLNPDNEKGKIVLITRFGAQLIEKEITELLKMIKKNSVNCSLVCDPMHGNTLVSNNGKKIRNFNHIISETEKFFKIVKKHNLIPAGVHLELTGDNVTECIGGLSDIADIDINYTTKCDPRLNAEQSVEFAFLLSHIIKRHI